MIRNGYLGYTLQDENSQLSEENKVLANSFRYFHTCKCGKETELNNSMFTDNAKTKFGSMTGWRYTCECGKTNSIWEGAFDSVIESFYESNLILVDNEGEY